MKIYLKNIGIINDAELQIDGLTVVAGRNGCGKSTVGKVLYGVYNGIEDIEKRNEQDKISFGQRIVDDFIRSGDTQFVYNRIKSAQLIAKFKDTPFFVMEQIAPSFRSVNEASSYLSDLKEKISKMDLRSLGPEVIDALGDKTELVETSIQRIKDIFVPRIDGAISMFSVDPDLVQYTNDWIAKSISNEMCNQVQPIKLKECASEIRIEDISQEFLTVKIQNKTNYDVSCHRSMKSVAHVFYLDNILDLDQAFVSIFERFSVTLNRVNETLPAEYYELMNSRSARKHNGKNRYFLARSSSFSMIEEAQLGEKISPIISLMNQIVPGGFASKQDGMYYLDDNFELNTQNMASGAKLMAILKILIMRGLVNEQTLLILDEPECHLHPEWQLCLAEIICMIVRELKARILLTTHNPNFLLAIDAMSMKYNIRSNTHFYYANKVEDGYMSKIENVDGDTRAIYASLSKPFLEMDALRTDLLNRGDADE